MAERTKDFSAVLLSNSNLTSDPTNTPSDFTVRFNPTIRLSREYDWEVALLHTEYPHNRNNVSEALTLYFVKVQGILGTTDYSNQENYKVIHQLGLHKPDDNYDQNTNSFLIAFGRLRRGTLATEKNGSAEVSNPEGKYDIFKRTLEPANYNSVQELQKAICTIVNTLEGVPVQLKSEFHQKSGMGIFVPISASSIAMFSESETLGNLLGMASRDTAFRSTVFAHSWAGIKRFELPLTTSLFVYVENLIDYQVVGDVMAPLLDIIPINKEDFGYQKHYLFTRPTYASVTTSSLDHVRILLRSQNGLPIPFPEDSPPVICKIHFKHREQHNAI
jgi:hypothetical protein